jgi:hypothetical protein
VILPANRPSTLDATVVATTEEVGGFDLARIQIFKAGPAGLIRSEGIIEKAQKSVVARSDVFGATSQPRFQHTI